MTEEFAARRANRAAIDLDAYARFDASFGEDWSWRVRFRGNACAGRNLERALR